MPIHRGTMGGGVNLTPTVSLNSATGKFNQDSLRGIDAYVNGKGRFPIVFFQYSTDINFGSYSQVSGSVASDAMYLSVAANITGLSVNTTYYVRCVVSTTIATVYSNTVSFLTWSLKTATYTAGTYSFTVPTISGINPAALVNVLVVGDGGGGGGNASLGSGQGGGGGGAGGYRYVTSRAFTGTNGALTIAVGSGAGGGGTSANGGNAGGASLSGTNITTLSAGGGSGGLGQGTNPAGGGVGSGDNPAYSGGSSSSYTIIKSVFYQGGGGAGVNGAGANGDGVNGVGGQGGSGGTINGVSFGAGGGGGYNGAGNGGGYGNGGKGADDTAATGGAGGVIVFSYYGP